MDEIWFIVSPREISFLLFARNGALILVKPVLVFLVYCDFSGGHLPGEEEMFELWQVVEHGQIVRIVEEIRDLEHLNTWSSEF